MEDLLSTISQHKYLVLLPLAIIEGPIISVIAGFLCLKGLLDPWYVIPILISGDIIGDSFYYSLGRWSESSAGRKTIFWFGIRRGMLDEAKIFLRGNPVKTVVISKIFLGIGVLGLVVAGNAKLPYGKFLGVCFIIAALQSIVYLIIGFLFGHAFIKINFYMNWIAASGIILFIGVLLFRGICELRKTL